MNAHKELTIGIVCGSILMLCSEMEQILSLLLEDTEAVSFRR